MNRTPRSASRRASRQLAANVRRRPWCRTSPRCVRLVRQVHELRHAGLHAERHLVLADARRDFRVVDRVAAYIRFMARTASTTPRCRESSRRRRIAHVVHRIAGGVELHPLVLAGQETAVPLARGDRLRLSPAFGGQHDKTRKVCPSRCPARRASRSPCSAGPEIDVPVFMNV
jgi:hypothetical protein